MSIFYYKNSLLYVLGHWKRNTFCFLFQKLSSILNQISAKQWNFFTANLCCPKNKAHKGNKAMTLESLIQMLFNKRDLSEAENRV